MSLGANLSSRAQFDDLIQENGHIPPSYCYRCWYGQKPESCSLQCAQALEEEIIKQGPETVSAFIAETISGSSLCAGYCERDDHLKRIEEICHKYDVLLILDEVVSGAGRTGKFLACEHFGVKPDIVAMAKGITGLYIPTGVVACSSKVSDHISERFKTEAFPMAFTSTNQPMMARAVVETMEIMKKEKLIENAAAVGSYLKGKLEAMHYTSTANSINKYYSLFPEELKPLAHDANEFFREANSRKRDMVPLSKCVASGCFEENQIEEITDIAALTFGGLLNRVKNNKADYGDSVETTKLQIRYLIRILKSYNPSIEEKIRSEYIIPLKNLIPPTE